MRTLEKYKSYSQKSSINYNKHQKIRKYSVGSDAIDNRAQINYEYEEVDQEQVVFNNMNDIIDDKVEYIQNNQNKIDIQSKVTNQITMQHTLQDTQNKLVNYNNNADKTIRQQSEQIYSHPNNIQAQHIQQDQLRDIRDRRDKRNRRELASTNALPMQTQQNNLLERKQSKSQSLPAHQNQCKSYNQSRQDAFYKNSNEVQSIVESPRSINDFLHRNYVVLNVQQSMVQMDRKAKECIEQYKNYDTLQQNDVQQLQLNRQTKWNHEKENYINYNNNKDNSIVIQKCKQIRMEREQQKKSQKEFCQFVLFDKINDQQIQQQHPKRQTQDNNSQKNVLTGYINQMKNPIQHKTNLIKLPHKSQHSFHQTNQNIQSLTGSALSQLKTCALSKVKIHNTSKVTALTTSQIKTTGQTQLQTLLDNYQVNKGAVFKIKNCLLYEDSLSLCNNNFIDSLSTLRKAVSIEQKIGKRQTQNQLQINPQRNSIHKLQDISYNYSNQLNCMNNLCKPMQATFTNPQFNQKQMMININDVKLLSDRTHALYQLSSRVKKRDNKMMKTTHFKTNGNLKKFTLNQLKEQQNTNYNTNLEGGSPKWNLNQVRNSSLDQNKIRQIETNLINYQSQEQLKNDNEQYYDSNDDCNQGRKYNGQVSNQITNLGNSKESNIYYDDQQFKNYNFNETSNKEEEFNQQDDNFNNNNNNNNNNSNNNNKVENNENKIDGEDLIKQKDESQDYQQNDRNWYQRVIKNMELLENNDVNKAQCEMIDKQFDDIFKTHFRKDMTINKLNIVYRIKNLAILKYKRQIKLFDGSYDSLDLFNYIRMQNNLQILLNQAKKISDIQKLAQQIEDSINKQDSRINSVVDELFIKFNINKQ